jgi:hypothetical protein
MEKTITYFYGDNNSEVFQLIHPQSLEKTAGISDAIIEFVKSLTPVKGSSYALINALSSGEFYGSNRNGDYFPEDALKEHHKTFEIFGHVYRHHINKDPNKSIGKVIFAYYNPDMHRVELIVELYNDKAKDIIDDLNAGKLPATSMGCKVPWDECSICGNRAKTRADYCSHLKEQMNMILPGGRKVYAINRKPKFFDISIVTIPAEKTSSVLKMFSDLINSEEEPLKKVAFYLENSYTKEASFNNYAEISKTVEAIGEPGLIERDPEKLKEYPKKLINLVIKNQNRINKNTLNKLAQFPLNEVMSTFLGLRIVPDPRDFQKLALMSRGFIKEAEQLENEKIIFSLPNENDIIIATDISLDNFNEKIAQLLIDEVPNLSITKELVVTRGLMKVAEDLSMQFQPQPQIPLNANTDSRAMWKQLFFDKKPEYQLTAHKNPILPLGILGSLYYGYTKVFKDTSTSKFKEFISKNPWLLPVLIGAGTAGSIFMQDKEFTKTSAAIDTFMRNSLIFFPLSYYYSAKNEFKAQQGEPITPTQDFVRKHPALIALTGALVGTKAESAIKSKFTKVANFVSNLPIKELNRIYIDLLNINGGQSNG